MSAAPTMARLHVPRACPVSQSHNPSVLNNHACTLIPHTHGVARVTVLLEISSLPQSSQLFSTVSRTRLVYSLRLSLYRLLASTFAGLEVFGSFNKLSHNTPQSAHIIQPTSSTHDTRTHNPLPLFTRQDSPLHTSQDRRDIISRTPAILQDIQTQLPGPIYVGMKHLADEFDAGGFVRVGFFKVHDESEGAVFEGRVRGTDDYCVPESSVSRRMEVLWNGGRDGGLS